MVQVEVEVGGCMHPQGKTAWLYLVIERLGWNPISVLFVINGLGNKPYHLVGPPFPAFKTSYSRMALL